MELTKKRISAILRQAEEALRTVIVEAAHAGDYDSIDLSRRTAGTIKELLQSVVSERLASSEPKNPGDDRAEYSRTEQTTRTKAKSARSGYPRFAIRKDTLHKISWSKKEKKEYEHKIAKDAYDKTVAAIQSLSRHGPTPFTAEQIVQQSQQAGEIVPIYQVYVALAFLRERLVLQRIGREGYTAGEEFVAAASQVWSQLANDTTAGRRP
jgi:hypothetical protein